VFRKRMECALMIKAAEALDPELAGKGGEQADDCSDCGEECK
jgi:hypothetical protein